MIASWLEKLGQFQFEIKHEVGKKIPHADCLSSVPTTTEEMVNQSQKTTDISKKYLRRSPKIVQFGIKNGSTEI